MNTYRNHEWHIMELPALTSPAAIQFTDAQPRTVRVYIVPGHYPDSETLGESRPMGGYAPPNKPAETPARDKIIAYLREHGPSTLNEIAGSNRHRNSVWFCVDAHPELFERTGELGKYKADIWRLKESAK